VICNQIFNGTKGCSSWNLLLSKLLWILDWKTFVNTLHGTYCHKLLTKAKVVWGNIQGDGFWDTCANFVHMVESILVALRAFNGKQWRRHGSHENVWTTCFINFHLATKNFSSSFMWRSKTFHHQSCGDWIHFGQHT